MANEERSADDKLKGAGGDTKAEPSGYRGGDNPATGGRGETNTGNASTPDKAEGRLNPSAPGETGTTPGTNGPQKS